MIEDFLSDPESISNTCISNAYCFDHQHLYLALAVIGKQEDPAKRNAFGVYEINLRSLQSKLLMSGGHIGSYLALGPGHHIVLDIKGDSSVLVDGKSMKYKKHDYWPTSHNRLLKLSNGGLLSWGIRSLALLSDDKWIPVRYPDDSTTFLKDVKEWNQSGICAGVDHGLIKGNLSSLAFMDISCPKKIEVIQPRDDGSILLGCEGDSAFQLNPNGDLQAIEVEAMAFQSIKIFQGKEYWGDLANGVYARTSDSRLDLAYKTDTVVNISTTDSLMTVNAATAVYIFDGKSWFGIRVDTASKQLFHALKSPFS